MSVSYGRAAAVFQWANENWQEFDGWCCVKGIDPVDLPAYRFYNLVLYRLREDLTDESLKNLEEALLASDSVEHPLRLLRSMILTVTKSPGEKGTPEPGPVQKQRYVPDWWRGDSVNAKVAMTVMGTLPK